MTWATRGTSEMPLVRDPGGRHRRKRKRLVGLAVAGGLLFLAASGVLFSPLLTGVSVVDAPNVAGQTAAGDPPGPTAVDSAGPVGTASLSASPTASPSTSPTASPSTSAARSPSPTRQSPTTSAPKNTVPPDVVATLEDDVFRRTNEAHQAACGGASLKFNATLRTAARNHSIDMARQNYFSHTGKDGSDPGQRMARAGYNTSGGWAENIAYGYPNAEAVMQGWMNSSGHRQNIENCNLHALGVGVARASNGQLYWTQDFGGL